MPRTIARLCISAALFASAAAHADDHASDATKGLTAHRAIYEMSLQRSTDSDLADADGRLVYEFTGSVCEGFSTQYRLVTRLMASDGQTKLSDMRTSSFEDAAGTTFDFVNQTYTSSVLSEDDKGSAARDKDGIAVAVAKPAVAKFRLPADALFPTQHLARLIEAAKAGQSVIEIKLFDGTDGGERVNLTTSVIGKELPVDVPSDDGGLAASPLLAKLRHWPVTISYFSQAKDGQPPTATPDYSLSMTLYENGVTRAMKLDYGAFVLSGKLVDLKPIEQKPCP